MDESRIRVRLKFHDPDLLTSQQIEQGLAQSWYLVLLEEVRTIADLAFDIRAAFHLVESYPNGLSLEVEGFVLPASQPARLLKDSDLITIKPGTYSQGKYSYDPRCIQDKECLANGHYGVELRALDEFEQETGGYESEQEEGEMETDISLEGGLRLVKETNASPNRKKEKDGGGRTHKRSDNVASEVGKVRRTKDLGAGQELSIVQIKDKRNSAINCGVSQKLGVKAALDEVEKETGKNRTEENESVAVILGEGKRSRKKSDAGGQSTLCKHEKIEKKRKRKELNIERQGQVPKIGRETPSSSDVQHTGEHGRDGEQKVKRKKRNHSGVHPVGATVTPPETMDQVQVKIVEANWEDGLEKGIKCSGKKNKRNDLNGLNNENDVTEGMLKKGTVVDKVGGKKRRKGAKLESPPGKHRAPEIKAREGSTPARTPKVNGEFTIARAPKSHANAPIQEQRPSRSARRKKAKRQWLREQAKIALHTGVETRVFESKGSKVQIVQRDLDTSPIREEVVEVEAEEEVLPIVVRAGHIRFEPYDISETEHQSRTSMPALLLGDQVKTKRQGQNWGQEKSTEKHKGKRLPIDESPEELGDKGVSKRSEHQIVPVRFEQHPALHGAPQEGDVLAYRLVELSASWTPEISPYRVGVVAQWEQTTNMIIVDPHPNYPRLGQKALEEQDELWHVEEMEVVGPYDENGVLEIEFSSLVEVRLMQRVYSENHEVVPSPSVEVGKELDPTTAGAYQADDQTREPGTDIGDSIPTGEQQGVADGETAELASALHALVSEELERKKTELCLREVVVTNASAGLMAPSEQAENVAPGSEGGKLVCQPKARRDRKYKFLKSAGVGSIVALLRAQQAL